MRYFYLPLLVCLSLSTAIYSQNEVPIVDYRINNFGQAELTINSEVDKYYLLSSTHEPDKEYILHNYMSLGTGNPLVITEPLSAYPEENYKVIAYPIATPGDIDGDNIDDLTEYENRPAQSPLNFGMEVDISDGRTCLTSQQDYDNLSVVVRNIDWAPFLNNQQFTKFAIINIDSDEPQVYFINSKNHDIHFSFYWAVGLATEENITSGEIVYNPNLLSSSGVLGKYYFNFSFGESKSFEVTQKTYELLAANMPFLQNNFDHFIGGGFEQIYINDNKVDFEGSRIKVLLESDILGDIEYIPFNLAEGYGLLRLMTPAEIPNSRDIVIYESLPNSLPRVGGIITSVLQTPLSHVNLRAIQDKVPNAYIKDPLENFDIAGLLNKYVYYQVSEGDYIIREASLDEVNAWYEKLRPTEEQIPERDLSQTKITPLDEIEFSMSNIFGAKCTNVATMRNFGFPDGTIPNGYGVPFYFYDEFMKFNNLYEQVEGIINQPDFKNDLQVREERLDELRDKIKDADMPQWMLDELEEMHNSFPDGTSIRCRSSTNNEDLPGFSGAGLYTSKTQHPDEGHMSKSIKQVFASMWNLRAYEEREFFRVDHFSAAMGVLCHPNYNEEKSNGVGISIDPIYQTAGNFYINTQVGEALVTNPNADEIPEEILLSSDPNLGYQVLRRSNLVNGGGLVMDEEYLNQLRSYLQVIHDEFASLYELDDVEGFGMDIEYKVTREDQLIIKQARPWVSFWADIKSTMDLAAIDIIEPESALDLSNSEIIVAQIKNTGLEPMVNFDLDLIIDANKVASMTISDTLFAQQEESYSFSEAQDLSEIRDYKVELIVSDINDGYSINDTLEKIITKFHPVEASLTIKKTDLICDDEIAIIVGMKNLGGLRIENFNIEARVNNVFVDTYRIEESIRSTKEKDILINVNSQLNEFNNEVELKLIQVNNQSDALSDNNTDKAFVDRDDLFTKIKLKVEIDDYPEENYWELIDLRTDIKVSEGFFLDRDFEETICVKTNSCYALKIYDFAGDGICCDYGRGNFQILNEADSILITNDGVFLSEVQEVFCPTASGCILSVEVESTNSNSVNNPNGEINFNILNGIAPIYYSIDGGQNFSLSTEFGDLAPGTYQIVVGDNISGCLYEETLTIVLDGTNSTDVFQNTISVYPNPTLDEVLVDMSSSDSHYTKLNLEVYTMMGELVEKVKIDSGPGNKVYRYSMENVASGPYIFRFHNEETESYIKVIKL